MVGIKFGSPTFLLRDRCASDLLGVLAGISQRGFEGAELFGLFGFDPVDIRRTCDDVGLQIMCDHIPYDEFVSDTKRVIEQRAILGTKYITIDNIPADKLPGTSGFSEAVKQIERVGAQCREAGMRLLYHNQGFDLIKKADGSPILEALLDSVDPDCLSFQPDLGWIALGGGDPEYYLDKYRDRCPVIHLKDYYASGPLLLASAAELGLKRGGKKYSDFEFRPTGYGIMNFARLMPMVLTCKPEWIVADHDLSYERDALDDLHISLEYVRNLVLLYKL